MAETTTYRVNPGGRLVGRLRIPGDKSVSHRAVMLGAIARGVTEVSHFLEGGDCLATRRAFEQMGVRIERPGPGRLVIQGVGRNGLQAPRAPLDLGNSGTSMRLMAGLLSGQSFDCELTGDASLSRRPMRRVADPLAQMGAHIELQAGGTAPMVIRGGAALHGIDYALPMASAQVKSCLLLAGLYAQGMTRVREPAVTRDHTERMLQAFGVQLERGNGAVALQGGQDLHATAIEIPGDISSAAFFLVGASLATGSDLLVENVGINPTRAGVIDILRAMGADIELQRERLAGAEPVADIRVRGAQLHGIHVPEALVPLAIDEFPALFVAAACAEGETVLTGAAELRVKESDRIQVMADGLRALGVVAEPRPDGIRIVGGRLRGGCVNSHGDHRVAMAFAMSALRSEEAIVIQDCANVDTSFPGFADTARSTGLALSLVGNAAVGSK